MAFSAETWIEIRQEYENIGTAVSGLAKKYDMSASAIDRRMKRDKWIKFKIIKDVKHLVKAEVRATKKKVRAKEVIVEAEEVILAAEAEVMDFRKDIDTQTEYFSKIHEEEHRQISVKNRAEAIAAEARLKLAEQNHRLINTIDHNDEFAIQKHNTLVNANKNVDTSRQSSGIKIDNSTTNNTQVNITIEETRENLTSLLGQYD